MVLVGACPPERQEVDVEARVDLPNIVGRLFFVGCQYAVGLGRVAHHRIVEALEDSRVKHDDVVVEPERRARLQTNPIDRRVGAFIEDAPRLRRVPPNVLARDRLAGHTKRERRRPIGGRLAVDFQRHNACRRRMVVQLEVDYAVRGHSDRAEVKIVRDLGEAREVGISDVLELAVSADVPGRTPHFAARLDRLKRHLGRVVEQVEIETAIGSLMRPPGAAIEQIGMPGHAASKDLRAAVEARYEPVVRGGYEDFVAARRLHSKLRVGRVLVEGEDRRIEHLGFEPSPFIPSRQEERVGEEYAVA